MLFGESLADTSMDESRNHDDEDEIEDLFSIKRESTGRAEVEPLVEPLVLYCHLMPLSC